MPNTTINITKTTRPRSTERDLLNLAVQSGWTVGRKDHYTGVISITKTKRSLDIKFTGGGTARLKATYTAPGITMYRVKGKKQVEQVEHILTMHLNVEECIKLWQALNYRITQVQDATSTELNQALAARDAAQDALSDFMDDRELHLPEFDYRLEKLK
jgi:hypothetical protein